MSATSSFTLPRRQSALDTTRRRGPPSPLNLAAACQKKISRTFVKYPEPNLPGVDQYVTRDTCCDRVVRSNHPSHQRKASLDLDWLGQRIRRRTSASNGSYHGRSHSVSVNADGAGQPAASRTFDGIYGHSYVEVDPLRPKIEGNTHSRQSSIDSESILGMSETQIAIPPLCLLGNKGDIRGFAQHHVSRF